jgi:fructose-bisphosphate aldolase, class II
MLLHSLSELYGMLPEGRFAIGAFNVHNMEYTQAVISAAESENAPVILMIGEPIVHFAGLEMLTNICQFAARNCRVPVVITLDHGKSREIIKKSLKLGLSIMFDGSDLPFEENLRITKEIVAEARKVGVSVEGEVGVVGGSEDNEQDTDILKTKPEIAEKFAKETGVDALAVAIGNCHGLYKGKPDLDIPRLKLIKKMVDIPLVLHGGSDLPLNQAKKAIAAGIKKFNIGTDLKYAFARSLKSTINREPMPFNPPEILAPAREAVIEIVRNKIKLFGSSGIIINT